MKLHVILNRIIKIILGIMVFFGALLMLRSQLTWYMEIHFREINLLMGVIGLVLSLTACLKIESKETYGNEGAMVYGFMAGVTYLIFKAMATRYGETWGDWPIIWVLPAINGVLCAFQWLRKG